MAYTALKMCLFVLLVFSGAKSQDIKLPSGMDFIHQTTTDANRPTTDVPEINEIPEILLHLDDQDNNENMDDKKDNGRCFCAVFDGEKTADNAKPIFEHPTSSIDCGEEGRQRCNHICIVAANRARGIGASIVCSVLGHSDGAQVSVYSKACEDSKYSFTGIADTNPICCHEGMVVNCKTKMGHSGHICS